MKIKCIQPDMEFGDVEFNFNEIKAKIEEAAKDSVDVIVLPETWNTGFFPKQYLAELSDNNGERVKTEIGALAKKYYVNIVAGSVANVIDGKVFNTAYVFSRTGECIGEYNKIHAFTPMGEHEYFSQGDKLCTFDIEGHRCGIIICYDIRFPELTRTMALDGLDILFVVSQWPKLRIPHLLALTKARAIENQMFVVCCNSCDTSGETVYGGSSSIHDPWGEMLALAGEGPEIIEADCDMSIISSIRSSINVFRDRRPEIYNTDR